VQVDLLPVPVPLALVPQVLRAVADYLDETSEVYDSSHEGAPLDPWDAVDEMEGHIFWQQALNPSERKLLRRLAKNGAEIPASDLAESMNLDSRGLAGLIGPLNKRCSAGGWPAAVVSRTVLAGPIGNRRRTKVLSVTAAMRAIVERGGEEDEISTPRVIQVKRSKRGPHTRTSPRTI
jgi:DNA-binding MarR family transcriptional regulator